MFRRSLPHLSILAIGAMNMVTQDGKQHCYYTRSRVMC